MKTPRHAQRRQVTESLEMRKIASSGDAVLAGALRRCLLQLSRRLRAERPQNSVPLTQLQLLGRLSREGACTASELAEHEHLQPQSLTRMLAAMERAQWIVRTQRTTDRRQFLIEITAEGCSWVVRDQKARDAWLARCIANHFSEEEKDVLVRAVNMMERLIDGDC